MNAHSSSHLTLTAIARTLGGNINGSRVRAPGPGHSQKDRSIWVKLDPAAPDGFVVGSFARDDWRACKDYVRQRLGLGAFNPGGRFAERQSVPTPTLASAVTDDHESRARTQRAASIWRASVPIVGTPAEPYLASRGVPYQGEALRWHPSCPFDTHHVGCMVAMVRNVITNEPQGVHRTAIDAAGRKLSDLGSNGRLALGPLGGGAVKLTDDADVSTVLGIGEGIETSLSIRELPDLSSMPVWSLLNANGIAAFPVLPGIETLWIAADNDASGTGQNAARSAAERLCAAGVETIVLAPTQVGADLNDRVARHA